MSDTERSEPVKKREELELLQIVLLDDISRGIREQQKSQARERLEGKVNEETLSCAETPASTNLLKQYPHRAWAKAVFDNKGPAKAYVSINNAFDWKEIEKDASYDLDYTMAEDRIEVIYHKAEPGRTASVLATGKY